MRELEIYDSQGNAVDGTGTDSRIRDYFFDGVRLTLDNAGHGIEIVCFFRARDSSASRSEQYYAVFTSDRTNDIDVFYGQLEERVEKELGMILESSTEDTTIFEMFGDDTSTSPPIQEGKLADATRLLRSGTQVKFGVGRYRDAFGLMRQLISSDGVSRLAIAENADSTHLAGFDVIIEKGEYAGVDLLPDTKDAVEQMKERRRNELNGYGSSQSGPGPGGIDKWDIVGGGMLFIGIALLAVVGVCWIGVNVPFAGTLPGVDCGGDGSPYSIEIDSATPTGNGTLTINGTVNDRTNSLGDNITLNVTGDFGQTGAQASDTPSESGDASQSDSDGPTKLYNETVPVNDTGYFSINLDVNATAGSSDQVTVSFRGVQDSTSVGSSTPNETESPTETSTDTQTETDTEAEPTETPIDTGTETTEPATENSDATTPQNGTETSTSSNQNRLVPA